jgi:hypothetical protein
LLGRRWIERERERRKSYLKELMKVFRRQTTSDEWMIDEKINTPIAGT